MLGFIAREMYLDWRNWRDIERQIELNERMFWASVQTAIVLGCTVVLSAAADQLRKPASTTPGRALHIRTKPKEPTEAKIQVLDQKSVLPYHNQPVINFFA